MTQDECRPSERDMLRLAQEDVLRLRDDLAERDVEIRRLRKHIESIEVFATSPPGVTNAMKPIEAECFYSLSVECDKCGGTGGSLDGQCDKCNGRGRVR